MQLHMRAANCRLSAVAPDELIPAILKAKLAFTGMFFQVLGELLSALGLFGSRSGGQWTGKC